MSSPPSLALARDGMTLLDMRFMEFLPLESPHAQRQSLPRSGTLGATPMVLFANPLTPRVQHPAMKGRAWNRESPKRGRPHTARAQAPAFGTGGPKANSARDSTYGSPRFRWPGPYEGKRASHPLRAGSCEALAWLLRPSIWRSQEIFLGVIVPGS
jgi:hypothetical protein